MEMSPATKQTRVGVYCVNFTQVSFFAATRIFPLPCNSGPYRGALLYDNVSITKCCTCRPNVARRNTCVQGNYQWPDIHYTFIRQFIEPSNHPSVGGRRAYTGVYLCRHVPYKCMHTRDVHCDDVVGKGNLLILINLTMLLSS